MAEKLIFVPLLLMVLLTAIAWVWMFVLRIPAMQEANIDTKVVRSQKMKELLPERVNISSEHFVNLFEIPVLFYVLVLSLFTSGAVSNFQIYSAFIFVGLRYIHTFIHLSYNHVIQRFIVYLLSCFVLWAMWLEFALEIISSLSI